MSKTLCYISERSNVFCICLWKSDEPWPKLSGHTTLRGWAPSDVLWHFAMEHISNRVAAETWKTEVVERVSHVMECASRYRFMLLYGNLVWGICWNSGRCALLATRPSSILSCFPQLIVAFQARIPVTSGTEQLLSSRLDLDSLASMGRRKDSHWQ